MRNLGAKDPPEHFHPRTSPPAHCFVCWRWTFASKIGQPCDKIDCAGLIVATSERDWARYLWNGGA